MTKILIIEDSSDLRKVVRDLLEKQELGFDIIEASSGEIGIVKAACEKPDIVLMDVALPKMNGIDAAKHIKKKIPSCDIIILTMIDTQNIREIYETKDITALIDKKDLYEKLLPAILDCKRMKVQKKLHREKGKRKT